MSHRFENAPAVIGAGLALAGIVAFALHADRANRPERYEGGSVILEEGADVRRSRYAKPCGELAVQVTMTPSGVFGGHESPESYSFSGDDVVPFLGETHDCGTYRTLVVDAER